MERRKSLLVLFHFKVRQDGNTVIYRGVKDRNGSLRMEKRRANSTNFKPVLFTGEVSKEEQLKNVLSRKCTALIEG